MCPKNTVIFKEMQSLFINSLSQHPLRPFGNTLLTNFLAKSSKAITNKGCLVLHIGMAQCLTFAFILLFFSIFCFTKSCSDFFYVQSVGHIFTSKFKLSIIVGYAFISRPYLSHKTFRQWRQSVHKKNWLACIMRFDWPNIQTLGCWHTQAIKNTLALL